MERTNIHQRFDEQKTRLFVHTAKHTKDFWCLQFARTIIIDIIEFLVARTLKLRADNKNCEI